MQAVRFHDKAREMVRELSKPLKRELGELLLKLQYGMTLGLPVSRPMPNVYPGAHELRLRDETGIYRAFYYTKSERGILVFHVFKKQSQKTPPLEIEHGRRRLKEMLRDEKD